MNTVLSGYSDSSTCQLSVWAPVAFMSDIGGLLPMALWAGWRKAFKVVEHNGGFLWLAAPATAFAT